MSIGDKMKEHQKKDQSLNIELLANTMKSINKAKDFQLVSDIIFKFIQKFVSYNLIVIYKFNGKENTLEVVSCVGSNAEEMKKRPPFKIGEGAIGLAIKDNKALLINDTLISKEIKVRQFYEDPVIRSFMAIPLIVGDNIIGIISVSCSQPHQYTDYDLQMISIITSQGAAFLELNQYIFEKERISDQILEKVNSGVMVIDSDYKVLVFNDAAEKITGFLEEEILGMKLLDIPLKERDNHWYIIKSMRELKIYNEEKAYMIRKNGQEIKITLSTSLLYNEDNSVKTCICIFRDTTEIEELQRQVKLSDKLAVVGRITAGITHEIRNPLLPIRNASEYLLNKFKDKEENRDIITLLNIIREESERLNRFLGQLSNLSKDNIKTGGLCDFNTVLDSLLILLRYNIEINNINLKINIDDKKIILACNEDNLRQVLLNLILNAVDAFDNKSNDDNKEINIGGSSDGDVFTLVVEDTGRGIPSKDLTNIFDPFYTTKDDGTGLGLPLSLSIINSIGGTMSVSSAEGLGTKIIIRIPIYNERMSENG